MKESDWKAKSSQVVQANSTHLLSICPPEQTSTLPVILPLILPIKKCPTNFNDSGLRNEQRTA